MEIFYPRFTHLRIALIMLFIPLCSYFWVNSQVLTNSSFESNTGSSSSVPTSWSNCGGSPDVQIISGTGQGIFGINTPASNGTTYMGMVTTNGQAYQEAMGQACNMVAGVNYSGAVDIFRSNAHTTWSGTGRIQFWGGSSCTNRTELLWDSGTITNLNVWNNHSFNFTPTQNHTFFTIVNFNNTGTGNGHYNCIDNLSMTTILPIELSSFTAEQANQGVNLNWETGNSLDGQDFEVTWSTDGSAMAQFETISSVEAEVGQTNFQFNHHLPAYGDNFYRLKMTDENGTITYSEIRKVNFTEVQSLELFPNPSNGNLHVRTVVEEDGKLQLTVTDISGRTVYAENAEVYAGTHVIDLNLASELAPGMYQIILTQAGLRQSKRFTIH